MNHTSSGRWRWCYSTPKFEIKIKDTGFKKPKDVFIKQTFCAKVLELKGAEDAGSYQFLTVVSTDPEEIANVIKKWWKIGLDEIPLRHELLFDVLAPLKDVKYEWKESSSLYAGGNNIVKVTKTKKVGKEIFKASFTVFWNNDTSEFVVRNDFRSDYQGGPQWAMHTKSFQIASPDFHKEMFSHILKLFKTAGSDWKLRYGGHRL